jgi:preprotein translocase subunit YajC
VSLYLLLVLIVVMVGFSKVQTNRRRKHAATLEVAIQPGVRVVTTAGIYGIVVEIESDTIVVEISEGVDVRFAKAAVVRVVPALDDEIDDAFDGGVGDDADDAADTADGVDDAESDAHRDADSEHDQDVGGRASDDRSDKNRIAVKGRKNGKGDNVVAGELSDADLHAELDAVSAPGGAGRKAGGNESGNGPVTGA